MVGADGQCVICLAMRYTLMHQLRLELPSVCDQITLREIGIRFGVIESNPSVPDRFSGGDRLAILSADLTQELLAQPDDGDQFDGD